MISAIKIFIDLTRLHFGPVWPLLFCSGAMLGFVAEGDFSWRLLIQIALIGFLGGTGGIVLNDYIDREYDRKDVEMEGLTRYWRPFGKRPIAQGQIQSVTALMIFCFFVISALILIFMLPYPQSTCVASALIYCYLVEWFYQIKKRNQHFPVSQLLGRTDFALFPTAGYIAVTGPVLPAFIYMIVFYPLAQVHLGVNDLADMRNDEARGMKSVPILYGNKGTAWWILIFSMIHISLSWLLFHDFQNWAKLATLIPLSLLTTASLAIFSSPTPGRALRMLPLIHVTIALEAIIIIVASALQLSYL